MTRLLKEFKDWLNQLCERELPDGDPSWVVLLDDCRVSDGSGSSGTLSHEDMRQIMADDLNTLEEFWQHERLR